MTGSSPKRNVPVVASEVLAAAAALLRQAKHIVILTGAGISAEPEGGRRLAPPRCPHCGGYIRPGVVWFGETLPEAAWCKAEAAVDACDVLLAIGTSGRYSVDRALARLVEEKIDEN